MKQPVPLAKMSKKAQREFRAKQRGPWNGVNPVTRIVPSGKAYKRSAAKTETRSIVRKDSGRYGAGFVFIWEVARAALIHTPGW